MKSNIFHFSFFVLLFMSLPINAQIDSRTKSIAIPAVKSPKDSLDSKPLFPAKPEEKDDFSGLTIPETLPELNLPKKEFSMFPSEEFANPRELYTKKLEKIEKTLLPEGHGENSGLKEDAYWGDYRTKSKYLDIKFRDYGRVDGDVIHLLIDDDIIKANIYLTSNFNSFRYILKEGLNKIEVFAVNEGSLIPNTAQYIIKDQWDYTITNRIWKLSTGVKTTLIIIKE